MRVLCIKSVKEKQVRLERKLVPGKRSPNENRRILKSYLAAEGSFSIYILMGENRSLGRDSKILHWESQDYLEEKDIENYKDMKQFLRTLNSPPFVFPSLPFFPPFPFMFL